MEPGTVLRNICQLLLIRKQILTHNSAVVNKAESLATRNRHEFSEKVPKSVLPKRTNCDALPVHEIPAQNPVNQIIQINPIRSTNQLTKGAENTFQIFQDGLSYSSEIDSNKSKQSAESALTTAESALSTAESTISTAENDLSTADLEKCKQTADILDRPSMVPLQSLLEHGTPRSTEIQKKCHVSEPIFSD